MSVAATGGTAYSSGLYMKLLLVTGLFSCAWHGGFAQYFHQPQLTYEPMTFDLLHRGTFNMSYCSRELLNCWEIIKADHMCGSTANLNTFYPGESEDNMPLEGLFFFWILDRAELMRWSVYESVCGIKREYCDDVQGDQDLYKYEFGLFEHYCPNAQDLREALGRRSGQAASTAQTARDARNVPQPHATFKTPGTGVAVRVGTTHSFPTEHRESETEAVKLEEALTTEQRGSEVDAVSLPGALSNEAAARRKQSQKK